MWMKVSLRLFRCHLTEVSVSAVLSLAWGDVRQQLSLSWLQQHTQQLPSCRGVRVTDTSWQAHSSVYDNTEHTWCSDSSSSSLFSFFRNGSPNHQPEPVVQVVDVSTSVAVCVFASCFTQPLNINIHIWHLTAKHLPPFTFTNTLGEQKQESPKSVSFNNDKSKKYTFFMIQCYWINLKNILSVDVHVYSDQSGWYVMLSHIHPLKKEGGWLTEEELIKLNKPQCYLNCVIIFTH